MSFLTYLSHGSTRQRGLRAVTVPIVVTLGYLAAVLFQEKIGVKHGLGWDGSVYGDWAAHFGSVIRKRVDVYQAQRVLPSALVYAVLKASSFSRSTQHIIRAFEVANVLLVAASAFSYGSVARRLELSRASTWCGAIALFGSFGIAKYSAFYPVLTDVWGFALGMLQLQFFLSKRVYALGAVTLLGAFAWPTLLPLGVVLLFFPRSRDDQQSPRPAPAHLNDCCAALLAIAWLWVCIPKAGSEFGLSSSTGKLVVSASDFSTGRIDVTVVRLSLLVSAAYLFWGVRQLLNHASLFDPRAYWRALSARGGSLAIVVAAVALGLRRRLSSGPSPYDLQSNLDQAIFSALKEPGIFALSHILYWGPFVLFIFFRWRSCVAAIHRAGIGVTLVALGGVALALNGESRKLVNLVPLFVLFALPELDRLRLKRRDVIGFGIAALVFSRVWITFEPKLAGALYDFPAQMLFMVIGPWMTPAMYGLQLAIVGTFAMGAAVWLQASLRAADAERMPASNTSGENVLGVTQPREGKAECR